MDERPFALIVAGPTCSGKSALALGLAERLGGTVINADAMQCYRELRVITARPTPAEEALVPHRLYGVRPAAEPGHAAWWRGAALAAMAEARAAGRLPILCGGTGLYFWSLVHGIADIPDVPGAVRAEARRMLARARTAAACTPRSPKWTRPPPRRLRPSDSQRLARAWEVWRATGSGLAAWQAQPAARPAPWRFAVLLLDPPREALRAAIAARFAAMLEQGALEEVRALLALGLDPALPAMRAHGVPELAAHLRGEITLAEAERRAVLATGQYTRRQATWFRHRHLVGASAHAYDPCADRGSGAIFGKRTGRNYIVYSPPGLTRRTGRIKGAPAMTDAAHTQARPEAPTACRCGDPPARAEGPGGRGHLRLPGRRRYCRSTTRCSTRTPSATSWCATSRPRCTPPKAMPAAPAASAWCWSPAAPAPPTPSPAWPTR